ncbi:MAG: TRAP transporter large permease [Deltaproteobacteria bacterium]|nr:TRAP transporter large permease [Deltaproteobacteria bacterium]
MGWVLVVLPFALLALGVPIYLIFVATTITILVGFLEVPPTIIPQVIFGSVDSFTLLAVPFFIFAGELMGRGGIATRLVQWFMAMFGRVRGSLALVTVASCELFGTMSGSSPATVAAIGRLMYPALRERGYEEPFALGLVTATGAIATVIPPSIMMILYAASAEQSVAKLFLGGFLPGILIGLLMAVYILIYARRTLRPLGGTAKFTWAGFGKATWNAVFALGVPLVILGGIYSGIFTPTEAAGIAGIYGIVVSRVVYRDLDWRGIWQIAVNSGLVTAQLMIIVAGSALFSWILTIQGIPQQAAAFIESLQMPQWGVLLALNLFLIVVGCLVDPASAILVLTPLLAPIAQAVKVDLVHFGIILTVNLSMGMFTPPFGLNIFLAQALFGAPTAKIYQGLIPFIVIQLIALMVITHVPELSLLLPQLF